MIRALLCNMIYLYILYDIISILSYIYIYTYIYIYVCVLYVVCGYRKNCPKRVGIYVYNINMTMQT